MPIICGNNAPMIKYGLQWPQGTHPLEIERYCIRKGLGSQFEHFKEMERLIWPDEFQNRWTDWMLRLLCEERVCVFGGCKDCVSEDTKIPNPITGEEPTIRQLIDLEISPTVMTMAGPRKATVPFLRGEGQLVEVVLSNGHRFVCSPRHYVLSAQGFEPVESLCLGQAICSAAPMFQGSISELYPSVRVSNALRWFGRVPDYFPNYRHESYSCGAPPQTARDTYRPDACIDFGASVVTVQALKNVGHGKFYDITVPGVGHYFSEGAIHHNSGKTRRVSKWALMDYWCWPECTLIVMTSTTTRGLELRVWGDIKRLWEQGRQRFEWLAGNPSDSKHGIFTDNAEEELKIRDMRKGIIGVPCQTSEGAYDGSALAEFAGIKQVRRRLIGDEMQHMSVSYLKVLYAMNAGNFRGAFLGNMIADNGMALDAIAEPEGGWGSEGEITKTTQWKNKYGGVTLNLVGPDSPNLDKDTLNQFPGMLNQHSIDVVANMPGGKDSIEWWSQIMGVRKVGVISDRPFTVQDVKNNGGFNDVVWASEPQKGLAIDAGYGGDDCVKTYFEFGEEVNGQMVIAFKEQSVYPVLISSKETPEDQIAKAAKRDCDTLGIPYENVYIEAGMRATLAVSFGRILSPSINAINFGGQATERPVANDLFINDPKTGEKRLKTCKEHYSKFVTELIFNVRDLVVSKQARLFPMKAAEEFQRRKWRYVYGDRYEIESKIEYKERNGGKSPNESDSIMIAVEGAIRLGFVIERIPEAYKTPVISIVDVNGKTVNYPVLNSRPNQDKDWLENEVNEQRMFAKTHEINYDN